MEALIPQLFILTVEASIVLFLIVLILLFFMRKNKKNDLKAVKQLVNDIKENNDFRIKSLASTLKKNNYPSNPEDKAKELHTLEKLFIQELFNVYIKRDVFRLDNIPTSLIDLTDNFIKLAGTANPASEQANVNEEKDTSNSEAENKNNTKILAKAAAIKEKHLKELSELRLKNTELNEHLFESLETITGLVTEHSKSQGGSDKPSAQQLLDAIIFLRDQREETDVQAKPSSKPIIEENVDETLFSESTPELGLTDILNTDLESDLSVDNLADENASPTVEDDPSADALAEQSEVEQAQQATTDDTTAAEDDPWADALAEQSEVEQAQQATTDDTTDAEDDP
ncbi:MAG: hypothetical protein QM479_05115, partial [Pseudomonadota bacterium]